MLKPDLPCPLYNTTQADDLTHLLLKCQTLENTRTDSLNKLSNTVHTPHVKRRRDGELLKLFLPLTMMNIAQ